MAGELVIRPLAREDRPSVLTLLSSELDWTADSFGEAMFEWEHDRCPLGASIGWGAFDGDRLVGARHLMPWDFHDAAGAVVHATRAMDMVVDRAYRRRGIASRITRAAVEAVGQRSAFIFSTPNPQGYAVAKSLGWVVLGTWPLAARPASPSVIRGPLERRPASRRLPEVTSAGLAAGDVVAQADEVEALLAARARPPGLETLLSPAQLAWRYGEAPLHYRVLLAGSRPRDGMAFFRIVRRGTIREARVCDMVVPERNPAAAKSLMSRLARQPGVDAIVRVGASLLSRDGFVRIPGSGILVVGQGLQGAPPGPLALRLGDLEVF